MEGSSTLSAVLRYFDAQASGYLSSSGRWPWAPVRRRESAAVLAALGGLRGAVVWELGCGAGFYTRLLLQAGAARVWAVDASAQMVRQLPEHGVVGVVGDAALIAPEEPFSHVLSAGMLEFVPDPGAVLAHVARHAAPGTRMVLLTPEPHALGWLYRRHHGRNGLQVGLFGAERVGSLAAGSGWMVRSHERVAPLAGVSCLERR